MELGIKMSNVLHSSFWGSPIQFSHNQRTGRKTSFLVKGKPDIQASFDLLLPVKSQKWYDGCRFSWFSGGIISSTSLRNVGLENRFRTQCTKEPFPKTRALIRSFVPLWKEGLFLFRCSIFVAVISAVGVLVWYGQVKARTFVETRLLPSVCSILSKHLQRELDFGKVHSVSPFGITLNSCSIGPHQEEFSCGEVCTMKLRIRPFASLRRGKVVVDAVLSKPIVLIAQKEDYSWLGIPSPSESGIQKRHSTEEGIDYRTKAKREAREKSAAEWARERVIAARKAAEAGYIVHQLPKFSVNDDLKDGTGRSMDPGRSGLFYCKDDMMHWRDHHCMDNGIGYGSKHADLEKSFGVKIPGQGTKFWSSMIPNALRRRFKQDARGKLLFEAVSSARQRNLIRSAAAAAAYFQSLDTRGSSLGSPGKQGKDPPGGSCEVTVDETIAAKDEVESNISKTLTTDEQDRFPYASELFPVNCGVSTMHPPFEAADGHSQNDRKFDMVHNNKILKVGIECQNQIEGNHNCKQVGDTCIDNDGDFKSTGFYFMGTNSGCLLKHQSADYFYQEVESLQDNHLESLESKCTNGDLGYKASALEKFGTCAQIHQSISFCHPDLKQWFQKFLISGLLYDQLADRIQKLRSCFGIKVEDIAAELADEVNESHSDGIENVIPIILDSVYFTDGNLMLLGFGDQEARSDP